MRIAVYVRGFPGSDDYNRDYTELACRLAAAGHDVTALLLEGPPPTQRSFRGVALVRPDRIPTRGMGRWRALGEWVSAHSHHFDVVFAAEWWNVAAHVIARSALRSGVPAVMSPWASLNPFALGRGWRAVPKRAAIRAIRAFYGATVPALQLYGEVDLGYAVRAQLRWPAFVAPLGIYDDYPSASPFLHWDEVLKTDISGRRILLFNARLDLFQKGFDYLLEGFAAAARSRGNAFRTKLVLSGRDPDGRLSGQIERAARMAQPLVRSGVAAFLGTVDAALRRDMIAHCDGFIYPSRVDGPPRPLREALWRGTPLVVTHETGVGHWVEAFGAGVAIDSPSAAGVRDAVVLFDSSSEAMLTTWREGARRLGQRLQWQECWRDYEAGLQLAVSHWDPSRRAFRAWSPSVGERR